jgi:hypothetical protein
MVLALLSFCWVKLSHVEFGSFRPTTAVDIVVVLNSSGQLVDGAGRFAKNEKPDSLYYSRNLFLQKTRQRRRNKLAPRPLLCKTFMQGSGTLCFTYP